MRLDHNCHLLEPCACLVRFAYEDLSMILQSLLDLVLNRLSSRNSLATNLVFLMDHHLLVHQDVIFLFFVGFASCASTSGDALSSKPDS
jgi:hypothetical protein